MGGSNIFSTLLDTSKNDSITNKSIVVLSARLDSFSMFDNISPGADSALTSVITLLSVADTLTKLKSELKNKTKDRNVLFALFDGEAFDYIGSSRVLYDMKANMFPVDPSGPIDLAQIRSEHFSHFIELSQLASHNNNETHELWIHKNIGSQKVYEISRLEDILIASVDSKTLNISKISEDKPLPPASLQTFLKSDGSMAGVVISNHRNEYSNKFYNSFYDDFINVNETDSQSLAKRLTQISKVVSKSIYQLLTNQTNDSIQPNETLVDQLLECYLKSPVCDLFRYVAPDITFHSRKSNNFSF